DVESLDRLLLVLAAAEQPAERRRLARHAILHDARFELLQHADDGALCGVAFDPARGNAGGKLRGDGRRPLRGDRTRRQTAEASPRVTVHAGNLRASRRLGRHAYTKCAHVAQCFNVVAWRRRTQWLRSTAFSDRAVLIRSRTDLPHYARFNSRSCSG